MHSQNPFPNTNLYHPDEQEIATYFDGEWCSTSSSNSIALDYGLLTSLSFYLLLL